MKSEFLRIGHIVRAHGVHGDVKVIPLTDDAARFRGMKAAFLEQEGAHMPVALENVRLLPDAVVLHICGTDSPEAAEKLREGYLCVDRAHAVKLAKDAYFVADLIGCEAVDTRGNSIGRVTDVLETGANDVYEIDAGRVLIPALKKALACVDVENGRIVFDADVLEEIACYAD